MKKFVTLFSLIFVFVAFANAQSTYTLTTTTYSSSTTNGSLITYLFSNSCSIANNNTKAYGTGTNGIKYSAGTKYTITFPSTINIDSINFSGYDNYAGKKSYFTEINSVTTGAWVDSTQYFFTAKNGTTAVNSTVTFKYPSALTTGTFTYTPAGNQIVATIKVYYTTGGTTGVETPILNTDPNKLLDVYSVDGRRVKNNVLRSQLTDVLPNGVYIIDHKKVVINRK
jgi:hypothetical protein